jgi:YggT family protein
VLSWFSGGRHSFGKFYGILCSITDPYLDWFRRFKFLRIGSIDLSPIAALTALSIVRDIFSSLGRFGQIRLGVVFAIIISAAWSAASFILGFFVIVLLIKLVTAFTKIGANSPFLTVVDAISQFPIGLTDRFIYKKRFVSDKKRIITSAAVLAGLYVVGGIVINIVIRLFL